MFSDLLAYSVNGLRRRVLRSALTVTGIVIGIIAIVVLISLGQGISDSVNSQLDSFSPNIVIVIPGSLSGGGGHGGSLPPTAGKLYVNDMKRLEKLDEINLITQVIMGRVTIQYRDESSQVSLTGIEPKNYQQSNSGLELSAGRFLDDNDKQVLVIGDKIAKDTFKRDLSVGSVVYAQGRPFRIVGILAAKGGSSFDDTDTTIYAPIDDMRDLLKNSLAKDEISAIYIELKDGADLGEAEEAIKFQLRSAHKVREGEEDFSLLTQKFIKERLGAITAILTLFLGGLASISLVVGGVTVANTMFASVLERYKEIGTLKAIGASKTAIFTIFLIESVILSVSGGLLGCSIATIFILLMKFFAIPSWLSWELYAGALAFALIVGVISGFSPAQRAANLEVVEALRYG